MTKIKHDATIRLAPKNDFLLHTAKGARNLKAKALLYYICRERDEGGVEPAGVNKQDIWPKFLVPGAILSIKRDVLNTQRGALNTQRDVLNTQHGVLNTQRDVLNTQHDVLNTQHDVLNTQRDVLNTQRDVLNTQHGALNTKDRARSIENWVRNTQKRLRRIGRLPCFYWVFDRAASGLNPIVRFH